MMESSEGKKAVVGLKESLREYSVAEPVQIGLCYSSLQNRYLLDKLLLVARMDRVRITLNLKEVIGAWVTTPSHSRFHMFLIGCDSHFSPRISKW